MATLATNQSRKKKTTKDQPIWTRIVDSEDVTFVCPSCTSCSGMGTIFVPEDDQETAIGCQPMRNFVSQPRVNFVQPVPLEGLPCRAQQPGEKRVAVKLPDGETVQFYRTERIKST